MERLKLVIRKHTATDLADFFGVPESTVSAAGENTGESKVQVEIAPPRRRENGKDITETFQNINHHYRIIT